MQIETPPRIEAPVQDGTRAGDGPAQPRSFKLRRGRGTAGQRAALQTLRPRYGIDPGEGPLDPERLFGRRAPLVLEIGFGMGEATLALATAEPDRDVIAVDVHTPGVGALLRDAAARDLRNVRVLEGDALALLRDRLAPGTLDELRLFFPDPWPKTRHHKRRLFSPAFARLAATRLRPGGRLHCATDWTPYAEQMLAVVAGEPLLVNAHDGWAPRPAWRPETRYERQGLALGRTIHDLLAHRVTDVTVDHP